MSIMYAERQKIVNSGLGRNRSKSLYQLHTILIKPLSAAYYSYNSTDSD